MIGHIRRLVHAGLVLACILPFGIFAGMMLETGNAQMKDAVLAVHAEQIADVKASIVEIKAKELAHDAELKDLRDKVFTAQAIGGGGFGSITILGILSWMLKKQQEPDERRHRRDDDGE